MAQRGPDPGAVAIGRLRWPVVLAKRVQAADSGSSLTETLEEVMQVRADVQPVGPLTFLGSVQTDRPVTHKITFRWVDGVDQVDVVLRRTYRPDHTIRTETFRVRRVLEIDGRKRFILIEAEQESRI